MKTVNKKVACTPFESKSIQVEIRNGMQYVKQKLALTPLTVVFDSADLGYKAGDTVWVRAEMFTSIWAKEEYELEVDGEVKKFILIPENAEPYIRLHEAK